MPSKPKISEWDVGIYDCFAWLFAHDRYALTLEFPRSLAIRCCSLVSRTNWRTPQPWNRLKMWRRTAVLRLGAKSFEGIGVWSCPKFGEVHHIEPLIYADPVFFMMPSGHCGYGEEAAKGANKNWRVMALRNMNLPVPLVVSMTSCSPYRWSTVVAIWMLNLLLWFVTIGIQVFDFLMVSHLWDGVGSLFDLNLEKSRGRFKWGPSQDHKVCCVKPIGMAWTQPLCKKTWNAEMTSWRLKPPCRMTPGGFEVRCPFHHSCHLA